VKVLVTVVAMLMGLSKGDDKEICRLRHGLHSICPCYLARSPVFVQLLCWRGFSSGALDSF
jgi:hypothetical protein